MISQFGLTGKLEEGSSFVDRFFSDRIESSPKNQIHGPDYA